MVIASPDPTAHCIIKVLRNPGCPGTLRAIVAQLDDAADELWSRAHRDEGFDLEMSDLGDTLSAIADVLAEFRREAGLD